MITQKRLRELLYYDEDTGAFTRRISIGRNTKIGDLAGCLTSNGYINISVEGKVYKAHRLAWFYTYGVWPDKIDHINGKRSANWILNLRDTTTLGNSQNQTMPKRSSTTGYVGVSRKRKRFTAYIGVDYKKVCLGTYDTPEEAYQVYLDAKKELHIVCTI